MQRPCAAAAIAVEITYTARRCSAVTVWQVLCTVSKSGPRARCLNLGRACRASSCAVHGLPLATHAFRSPSGARRRRRPARGSPASLCLREESTCSRSSLVLGLSPCSRQGCCSSCRYWTIFVMLDWLLVKGRRAGFERSVRDRSHVAASRHRARRPAAGETRARALEGGTTSHERGRRSVDWNTSWHRFLRELARDV